MKIQLRKDFNGNGYVFTIANGDVNIISKPLEEDKFEQLLAECKANPTLNVVPTTCEFFVECYDIIEKLT